MSEIKNTPNFIFISTMIAMAKQKFILRNDIVAAFMVPARLRRARRR